MGFVLHVSVLCVFFSTMESSIPSVPRSTRLSRANRSSLSRFHLALGGSSITTSHVQNPSAAVFPDCTLRRECRGKRRKLKTLKHESLQQKQEKAPEPPENRDSRRKSNASRVGGGVRVRIHAYSHSIYTVILTRSFRSPCPRYNY